MAYDDTLPTDKDRVRAILGDTDTSDELLTDAHIEAVLTAEGSVSAAVAWLADALVARFAQDPVRITADGVTLDYSRRIPVWQSLATRERGVGSGALSFVAATFGDATTATDEYSRPLWWQP